MKWIATFFAPVLLWSSLAADSPRAQDALRVAVSDSPPISFKNAGTGSYEGLAVDVMQRIAVDARLEMIAFGSMLSALNEGRTDVVVMSGSDERRRVARFSASFARYGEALLVRREDAAAYTVLEDLKDKTVGSNAGGGWIDAATKAGAKIVTFGSAELSLNALQNGEVQAVVGNAPTYRYLMRTGSYPNVRVAASYAPRQLNELAFAVRPSDGERLARINAGLKTLGDAGVLDQLRAKWGF